MHAPRRLRLDNELTVILAEHRGADVVAVQLWVRAGARDETEAEAGLSHFLEHLLFKGTPSRGPGEIDRTISALGGEMNAATSQDFTYYHVVLPARHLATALDVVADAAMNAVFDPAELERERLVVLEEIRRSRDSPSGYLWRILTREHFTGHPYGLDVLGTPESIGGAPRDRVMAYHRRHYAPGNATVVVAGNVEPADALAQVQKAFGGWERRPVAERPLVVASPLDGVRRTEESRALQQTYLGMAWRAPVVPDPDVYATDLLSSVLGRGRTSRLYQRVKERRGLVSTIGGTFYIQREAGTLTVTARSNTAAPAEIEAAILEEAARLRAEPVEDGELARALTGVEAGYAFGNETAEGLAYSYGMAETVWTLEFELGYLDAVRQVTRERVRDAAARYLAPDRFTAALLRPDGTER
jgi:zinc protease